MLGKRNSTLTVLLAIICILSSPYPAISSMMIQQEELVLTISMSKQRYQPNTLVRVNGLVTNTTGYPTSGAYVGIQIVDPNNNTVFLDIALSGADGAFNDSFRLQDSSILGEYRAYATASAPGYETGLAQANFTVTHQGDLNGDGIVDIFDVVMIAALFGLGSGDQMWNPNVDINDDLFIDIFDVVIVAVHFGETS